MIFTYDIIQSESFSPELFESFSHLNPDPYLKHKYPFRKRSFSRFHVDISHSISLIDDNVFTQSEQINSYNGGLIRTYPPVCPITVDYIRRFLLKHDQLFSLITKQKNYEIGVHQIRITCINMNEGLPVPEGYHQDGFDYVCLIPVCQNAICGGAHSLRYGSQDGPEILTSQRHDNQSLILNDKHVFHYASPIYPRYQDVEGTRDTIVVTFKLEP